MNEIDLNILFDHKQNYFFEEKDSIDVFEAERKGIKPECRNIFYYYFGNKQYKLWEMLSGRELNVLKLYEEIMKINKELNIDIEDRQAVVVDITEMFDAETGKSIVRGNVSIGLEADDDIYATCHDSSIKEDICRAVVDLLREEKAKNDYKRRYE